jgi:hypothetical protein
LRQVGDERLLAEVPNLGLGDAILFRLSRGLQHRVTDVVGAHPKTAFAGWFRTDTSYREVLSRTAMPVPTYRNARAVIQ